ncbi:hypothetical protein M8J76_001623 [Diaphorina citri]|nr:hypothetical protein M8J76_001623 [Diaphorina citri]
MTSPASTSSDSEEFYDAEDNTPNRSGTLKRPSAAGSRDTFKSLSSESDLLILAKTEENDDDVFIAPAPPEPILERKPSSHGSSGRQNQRKFQELRTRMQTEDEEVMGVSSSPPDSQTSSIEGVFASDGSSHKTSHPFKIIEHDALSLQSMTSLGRVGRLLSGMSDTGGISSQIKENSGSTSTLKSASHGDLVRLMAPHKSESSTAPPSATSSPTKDKLPSLQEPDVIASTKASNNTPTSTQHTNVQAPVAPPRRKKKTKQQQPAQPPQVEATAKQVPPEPPASAQKPGFIQEPATPPVATPVKPTELPLSNIPVASREENSATPVNNFDMLAREFEHSLDIKSAIKGQYVVKPQDLERPEHLQGQTLSGQSSTYPLTSSTHNINTRAGLGLRLGLSPRPSKERRRSAGDETGLLQQSLNMFVRTRTDSGKPLSDMEILEQVTVLNLDTGERVPLSIAEDKLPQCINPLSLHIMRLTSEYVSNPTLEKEKESDEESVDSKMFVSIPDDTEDYQDTNSGRVRRKTAQLKRFLGSTVKKTMDKAKNIAHRHKEDVMDIVDEELNGEHTGPVWCMKFSVCGRLLATAGQDRVLRIWVVRTAYSYFQDMRTKYNAEKVSPTPSQESLVSQQSSEDPNAGYESSHNDRNPFMPKPFCTYVGHTSDLLDVAWSKNYFVLSSSMDKTVRLWHISRKECLCCFQHIDFVTAICFHPRDDRYFLSGSLDGKLRLWNIPDKKVAVWNEVEGQTKLITAANFCENGKFAVVGSYDGRCIFYTTDQLKYHTQIHVRSTRGKNATGRKISGIEPMPGEDKILVTSNDSRIRLYDLRDLNLSCKYKGYVNVSSQIKASFSHDGKYIVSGSENQCIYIWKTHHDYAKFSSVRRDRNDFWEGIKAHNAVVTCAVFAPCPELIIAQMEPDKSESTGYVLVSADFNGVIRVFLNKTKPKHSSLPVSALA